MSTVNVASPSSTSNTKCPRNLPSSSTPISLENSMKRNLKLYLNIMVMMWIKTTEYLDVDTETELLWLFSLWASANPSVAEASGNHEVECFYDGLRADIQVDCHQSTNEYDRFNLQLAKQVDGRSRVVELKVQHEDASPLKSRDNILGGKRHSPSESDAGTSCFIELPPTEIAEVDEPAAAHSTLPRNALTERQPTPNTSSTSRISTPI